MIIAIISSINIVLLYWYPFQISLSSYLATSLMFIAYAFKLYYLVPISLLICIGMFFAALSFQKEQTLLPIGLFVYLHCDLFLLVCNVGITWLVDKHFLKIQATQLFISFSVIILMYFYFALLKRHKRQTNY